MSWNIIEETYLVTWGLEPASPVTVNKILLYIYIIKSNIDLLLTHRKEMHFNTTELEMSMYSILCLADSVLFYSTTQKKK